MANVVAKVRGYYGGLIREAGAVFDVPDNEKPPKWTRPHAFGGKGDHDGDGKTGGSKSAGKSAGAIVIPADWRDAKPAVRKALAKQITGENAPNAAEADRVIAAYVETNAPEPFSDAPAPETVTGSAVMDALGGVQPDWVAPGSDGKASEDI